MGLLILAGGGGLLWAGAELFTEHAAAAGRRLRVTALAVGVLLAGAEPEELVTTLLAAARDRPGIALGDALGANLVMLTLVLGLASLFRPLPFGRRVARYAALAVAAAAAALVTLSTGRTVTRVEGVLLVVAYVALAVIVWRGEHADDDDVVHSERFAVPLMVAGVAVMGAGGWLAVVGAERIVEALGTDDERVGLTLVALATTLELVALVAASARRGVSELAVAAVVGSAISNSTLSVGAAAVVTPLPAGRLIPAAVLALALPVVLLAVARPAGSVTRPAGAVLAAAYAVVVVIAVA